MATAENLPTNFTKNLYYRNPRMTNVTSNNALGVRSVRLGQHRSRRLTPLTS